MARSRSSGQTLDKVVSADGKEMVPAEPEPPKPKIELPDLPDSKTQSSGALEHKMVVIHGPPGVGKTTLASEWAGGDVFFFNCAGELGDLEVYQAKVGSWEEFRLYAASLAQDPEKYTAAAIDTADVLGKYCSEVVRRGLGIRHESDLEWGVGWQALRDEWQLRLAKLAAIPNLGVIYVTHSTEVEVKTRSAQWNKSIFRGVKAVREAMLDMADLVLFIDKDERDGEEVRIIHTKPSRYFDAKERSRSPKLPDEIIWPYNSNGWDLIKEAWDGSG